MLLLLLLLLLHLLLLLLCGAGRFPYHCTSAYKGCLYNPVLVSPFTASRAPRQKTQETSSSVRRNFGREMSYKIYPIISTSTVIIKFFNMPQICYMGPTALLPTQRKTCWGFFSPRKIRRLWPGLNPQTLVPETVQCKYFPVLLSTMITGYMEGKITL
jgi:hypothetical protein